MALGIGKNNKWTHRNIMPPDACKVSMPLCAFSAKEQESLRF